MALDNSHQQDLSAPPDGGYGWVCVLAGFLLNGFTWGVVAVYGVYLQYFLSQNLFPDGTTTDFAVIGGFQVSMALVMAPAVTALARIYGTKVPMALGTFMLSGGFVAASVAHKIWQLYLSLGVMVGFGVGLLYIPSLPVISQWFLKRRSLANAICAAGSGIGGLIMSFATQAMLQHIGLGWSLRITGLVVLVTNSVAIVLIRDRNDHVHPTQRVFDVRLLRIYEVRLLLLWSFVSMFGYITLLYSLPDYGKSIGLSDSRAAAQAAFLNLGAALGRPFIGVSSDRFGRIRVAGMLTFACGIGCFVIWIPAKSYAILTLFSITSGAVLGVFWATIGPLGAEVVGLKELPSVLSIAWIVIILPTTVTELIALKLRRPETAHPWLYPQVFTGLSYLLASLCMLELFRVSRHKSVQRTTSRV